jgi:hypothetical protein
LADALRHSAMLEEEGEPRQVRLCGLMKTSA